ncbi:hypothetical protein K491DRAFT_687773 [Lophiostoma macrostomum CBS 122681]|uniref:MYND-type domain-containing protein n=1 Tax=Lophiostoma macrostomum CBS 122681 TaxID=1314788 RepID=A0A6A6TP37_9PLEO|nr:hypothetical protein K491DRAFT_687773 [Lophiostoma macrostomum CBS 122681]
MPGTPVPMKRPIPEVPVLEPQGYLAPNPAKTSRQDFTDFFLQFRCAPDAHPQYRGLFETHQKLVKLCFDHPAMEPNRNQTFDTPANSKNKVYFMWDYLLRTFQHIAAQLSPQHPTFSEMWMDVTTRTLMAHELMLDETGKLEAGNRSIGYNDDHGVEFTDEIKTLAKELEGLLVSNEDGCRACGKDEKDDGSDLLQCSRCKKAKYCSRECQKRDWKMHKATCK